MEAIHDATDLGGKRPAFVDLPVPADQQIPLLLWLNMNREIYQS